MQALIDFDGWRKWKDFSQTATVPITVAPALLNNSSGSTVASIGSIKDALADSPRSATKAGDGFVVGVKTMRKAKRTSGGAGLNGLMGVAEDVGEGGIAVGGA